jgi:tRNA (guanine10-N2)-methyltransferase
MDSVDDSHGYCKVSRPSEKIFAERQYFDPILISKYQESHSFDGTTNHLEYFYKNGQYDKVNLFGGSLLENPLLKYSLKRELIELLVRANLHLRDKQATLKYLSLLLNEYKSEDPGRDYLRIRTFDMFGMNKELFTACNEYLKLRPGDLNITNLLIKCSVSLGIDCTELIKNKDQIIKSYQRGRPENIFRGGFMKTICRFAQIREKFRLGEIESLFTLFDPSAQIDSYSLASPFALVSFKDESSALQVLRRSSIMNYMCQFFASSSSLEDLLAQVRAMNDSFVKYKKSSFKFEVDAFGKSIDAKEQVDLINSFSFMPLEGPINLKEPEVTFVLGINYRTSEYIFGKKIICESMRKTIDNFSLKKRIYLGTTSMDAELSFIMANLGRVQAGDFVYDPFVGTGSLLYIPGFLGAFTIGSDIDGRQMRGTTKGKIEAGHSLQTNLLQYGVEKYCLGGLIFDITQHPWRSCELFDSIICDPPYGVRAGAKRIAKTVDRNIQDRELYWKLYPTTKPYEIGDLVPDLLEFSSKYLKRNGRLVFWYPEDDGPERDFPQVIHQHDSMQVLYFIPQKLQRMSRWLMVYVKK